MNETPEGFRILSPDRVICPADMVFVMGENKWVHAAKLQNGAFVGRFVGANIVARELKN